MKTIASLVFAIAFLFAGSASANLCREGDNPEKRRVEEAAALQSEAFTTAPGYQGSQAYDARVLECNRRRDTLGKDVERAITATHRFAQPLAPLLVKGHIQYLGFAGMRYGYALSREADGTWAVTVPAEFHLPSKDKQALDVPQPLAVAPIAAGGMGITCDTAAHPLVISTPEWTAEFQACRVGRGERFGGVSPETLLYRYWKKTIEEFWSRPGFTVRVQVINLGQVDAVTLKGYEKENIVWHVRMNDRPTSRAMYKAMIGKPHPIFTGIDPWVIAHEFGHQLGLDDEYGEDKSYPAFRDCPVLSQGYIMCQEGMKQPATEAKGLYAWIVTRRYAVADQSRYECKTNADCATGQFCDTGAIAGMGANRCVAARAECDACSADKQCATPLTCTGKPAGRCAQPATRAVGATCCRDDQCGSKSCSAAGVCQCKENSQCPSGQYCDTGTATFGRNQCVPFHAECESCSADKQCRSPATCKGMPLAGRCVTAGSMTVGASCCQDTQCRSGSCSTFSRTCQCGSDSDCPTNQSCKKGFLGAGRNQCQADTKNECDTCSSDAACTPPNVCLGKPLGRCGKHENRAVGAGCCKNDQCGSQNCEKDVCVCKTDADCGAKKCKKPLGGQNRCE